jgi:hypothetical protein
MSKMTLKEQVDTAVERADTMFGSLPVCPDTMTREELWMEILRLRKLIRKPKVQDLARTLLEDHELESLPYSLLASIIQAAFKKHGFECECSESSMRWYVSQFTLTWDIAPRKPLRPEVIGKE